MNQDFAVLDLPDGFEFGCIESDEDLEELITFNDKLHGPGTGEMLGRLIDELPDFGRESNYIIRDLDAGRIASTMNAIPSRWAYEGISLRNLELGFVGTLEEYRRKGLFNILYKYFDHLLKQGNYDISSIQGIPYFYRRYGYDFILPLMRTINLQERAIPSIQSDAPPFMNIQVRKSSTKDIPRLMELYSIATSNLMVYAERDETLWKAQEKTGMSDEKPVDTMVLERDGVIDGYFRFGEHRDSSSDSVDSIFVKESGILSYDSVLRTLHFLKKKAQDVSAPFIEFPGDTTSNLAKISIAYGGVLQRGWKYQIRVPNLLTLLNKIRPVIEGRLKNTMYEGFTREISINIYETCYKFNFVQGKLEEIEDIGMQSTEVRQEYRIPPHDFIRLIFGDYSVDELRNQDIDFTIRPGKKHLLELMFPKKASYLYNYQV